MTDAQINQAIAETCGWKEVRVNGGAGVYKGFDNGAELRPDIPDYCTDLNAMHEAEKFLRDANLLFEYGMHISNSHHYEYLLRATAQERAEAFLKTLGKWEEAE